MSTGAASIGKVKLPYQTPPFWLIGSTYLLELVAVVARYMLIKFLLSLIVIIFGVILSVFAISGNLPFSNPDLSYEATERLGNLLDFAGRVFSLLAFAIALFPLGFCFLTWLGVYSGGGYWTRLAIGARQASKRELKLLQSAYSTVYEQAHASMKPYVEWAHKNTFLFIIDQPIMNAYSIGNSIYLSRELVRSNYLPALLAREYGHIMTGDSNQVLALRRLVFYPVNFISRTTNSIAPGTFFQVMRILDSPAGCGTMAIFLFLTFAVACGGGGIGLYLLSPFWQSYWRDREYAADKIAAWCTQHKLLVEYLESNEFFDVAVPYFLSPKPYTELRIDKL